MSNPRPGASATPAARARRLFEAGIVAYRGSRLHALWHADGSLCRFIPSCSEYAVRAVALHGPLVGSVCALWRLLRCNPWVPSGALDYPRLPPGREPPDALRLEGRLLIAAPDRAHLRLYPDPLGADFHVFTRESVLYAASRGDRIEVYLTDAGPACPRGAS